MAEQVREYLLRVRDVDNRVVGAAFLAGPGTVVTCAHVVARAMGKPDDLADPPPDLVRVDFPRLRGSPHLDARVVAWRAGGESPGDIAVLELTSSPPEGAAPARLMRGVKVWRHAFNVLGFPEGYDDGVIATGTLLGAQGAGWIQMDQYHDTAYRVESGFSGAPVFDEVLNGVVGMTVAADVADQVRSAYMQPADVLLEVWPQLADRSIVASPYRSLRPFAESDADVFFGREAFVRDRLLPATRQAALVAVVVGSSGSGKTSVVFAGLLPALKKDPVWSVGTFRPDERPFHGLATPLVRWLDPDLSEVDGLAESVKLGDRLARAELRLEDVVTRLAEKSGDRGERYLLVADEFEKLFTLSQERQVPDQFLAALADVVSHERQLRTPTLTIVITMRADFMQQALDHPAFAAVLQDSTHFLGAMTREELRDAIVKPAATLDVEFADGLVDRIIDDVGTEPGRLPLLQFAMTLLWTEQEQGRLTHAAYESIGQVEGALAKHAEGVFDRLNAESQALCRRLFVQLVQPGPIADTRRVARRSEFGNAEWALAQQLSYDRLVIVGRDDATGAETVEVIHEALIGNWDRLRAWIDADRDFRAWQERTRSRAVDWQTAGREESELLRGAALAEAEERLAQRGGDLGTDERELIEASIAERTREEAEKAAGIQRQLRTARRRQWAAIGFAVVALIAVVSMYAAITSAYEFDPVAFVFGPRQVLGQDPMVDLPGGSMIFGTDSENALRDQGEAPLATMTLAPFAIQQYEVSTAQFRTCHLAGSCGEPALQTYWQDSAYDDFPIVYVTATQAQEFCVWLGARLPDTYEWENAARGNEGRPWPWGDGSPEDHANVSPLDSSSDAELVYVRQMPEGASIGTGIFNLVGNASEWTVNTLVPDGESGLRLGDVWNGDPMVDLAVRGARTGMPISRVTEIDIQRADQEYEFIGFRCVRSTT